MVLYTVLCLHDTVYIPMFHGTVYSPMFTWYCTLSYLPAAVAGGVCPSVCGHGSPSAYGILQAVYKTQAYFQNRILHSVGWRTISG